MMNSGGVMVGKVFGWWMKSAGHRWVGLWLALCFIGEGGPSSVRPPARGSGVGAGLFRGGRLLRGGVGGGFGGAVAGCWEQCGSGV